jgi:hypothetical protein
MQTVARQSRCERVHDANEGDHAESWKRGAMQLQPISSQPLHGHCITQGHRHAAHLCKQQTIDASSLETTKRKARHAQGTLAGRQGPVCYHTQVSQHERAQCRTTRETARRANHALSTSRRLRVYFGTGGSAARRNPKVGSPRNEGEQATQLFSARAPPRIWQRTRATLLRRTGPKWVQGVTFRDPHLQGAVSWL